MLDKNMQKFGHRPLLRPRALGHPLEPLSWVTWHGALCKMKSGGPAFAILRVRSVTGHG